MQDFGVDTEKQPTDAKQMDLFSNVEQREKQMKFLKF